MAKLAQPVSKEVIGLVGPRISAAQLDLYNIMKLMAAMPLQEDDESFDHLAICGAVEALAARCGRILDTCAEKLGTIQAGYFSDFEMMEACQEQRHVGSEAVHG